MWIIHEPKKLALWNKRHFDEKNGECAACLKYSVLIFVEKIYKMQYLEGFTTDRSPHCYSSWRLHAIITILQPRKRKVGEGRLKCYSLQRHFFASAQSAVTVLPSVATKRSDFYCFFFLISSSAGRFVEPKRQPYTLKTEVLCYQQLYF